MELFTDWLQKEIGNKNIPMSKLCDDMGVRRETVWSHLTKAHRPRYTTVKAYAEYFGANPYTIYNMVRQEFPKPPSKDKINDPVGEFGCWLYDMMKTNDIGIKELSKMTDLSTASIRLHIHGRLPTRRTANLYCKAFRYANYNEVYKMIGKEI